VRTTSGTDSGFTAIEGTEVPPRSPLSPSAQLHQLDAGYHQGCARFFFLADGVNGTRFARQVADHGGSRSSGFERLRAPKAEAGPGGSSSSASFRLAVTYRLAAGQSQREAATSSNAAATADNRAGLAGQAALSPCAGPFPSCDAARPAELRAVVAASSLPSASFQRTVAITGRTTHQIGSHAPTVGVVL
jgi:hypothetical protein